MTFLTTPPPKKMGFFWFIFKASCSVLKLLSMSKIYNMGGLTQAETDTMEWCARHNFKDDANNNQNQDVGLKSYPK